MVSTAHSGLDGGFGVPSSDPRVDILGIRISAVNMSQALDRLVRHISGGHRGYVCVTDVNALLHARRDPELRRIFNTSTMTVPDGVPLVWAGKSAGADWMGRVCGPDLMPALLKAAAEHGWASYFLGGAPHVAEEMIENFRRTIPGLEVAGCQSPPFRELTPEEETALVQEINALGRPDRMGGSRRTQAGNLDGLLPRPPHRAAVGRRRRGLRHARRAGQPGSSLDAAERPRMGLPVLPGAPPAVEALHPERARLRAGAVPPRSQARGICVKVMTGAHAAAGAVGGRRARSWHAGAVKRVGWGLGDQALSSMTNFAVGILVARSVSVADFGAYALAFSAYCFILGISRALATEPFAVRFVISEPEQLHRARVGVAGVALLTGVAFLAAGAGAQPDAASGVSVTRPSAWVPCSPGCWSRTASARYFSLRGGDGQPSTMICSGRC